MSGFNISAFTNNQDTSNNSNTLVNTKYDDVCFKESMSGIEKYWKEIITNLDTKKKDVVELNRLYNTYKAEEYIYLIDSVNIQIKELEDKLSFIQKVMWDIRTKIIFSK